MSLRKKNIDADINEDKFKDDENKTSEKDKKIIQNGAVEKLILTNPDYLTPKVTKRKAECPPAPRPSKKSSRSNSRLSMVFESIDFTENDEKRNLLEDNLKELKLFSDEITSYKDRNDFIDAIHEYLSTSHRPLFK